MKLSIFFTVLTSVVLIGALSCKKNEFDKYPGLSYVTFDIGNNSYELVENDFNVFDLVGYEMLTNNNYNFSCRLLDMNSTIHSNFYQIKTNYFKLLFYNIDFNQIDKGNFPLAENNSDSGVGFVIMTPDYWNILLEKYKQSQEYSDCLSISPSDPPEDYCDDHTLGYDLYFESFYLDQTESFITIKECKEELISKSKYCWENNSTLNTKVISGIFNCNIRSKMDTTLVEPLKGEFRLRIPEIYNSLCE